MKKPTSIAKQLNLILFAVIGICLLLFTALIGWYSTSSINQKLHEKSNGFSDLGSLSLSEPLWNFDDENINKFSRAILNDPDIVGVRVTSQDGEVKFANQVKPNIDSFEELKALDSTIYRESKISKNNEVLGTVEILISTERATKNIQTTLGILFLLAIFLLTMVIITISLTVRKTIKKPINELKRTAKTLAGGEFDITLNIQRNDELGVLADSFDKMRLAIKTKIDELRTINEVSEEIQSETSQENVLRRVLNTFSEAIDAADAVIYLRGEDAQFHAQLGNTYNFFEAKTPSPESFLTRHNNHWNLEYCNASDIPFINQDSGELWLIPVVDDHKISGLITLYCRTEHERQVEDYLFFFETLSRITATRLKNLQMIELIRQHNLTLEERVAERTRDLWEKTNDINVMLQNLQQGVFTITADFTIHPEYSSHLEDVLEETAIAGKKIKEILLEKSDLSEDLKSQLVTALTCSIGEDTFNFEANLHLMPAEFTLKSKSGQTKVLQCDWAAIGDQADKVQKILVSLRDVTKLKELETAAHRQKQELEIISQVLSMDASRFRFFIENAYKLFDQARQYIQKSSEYNADTINLIFRSLHSLKGNARTHGLRYLANAVHEAESVFSSLRGEKDNNPSWSQDELLETLKPIEILLAKYKHINDHKLGRAEHKDPIDRSTIKQQIDQALSLLADDTSTHTSDVTKVLRDMRQSIEGHGTLKGLTEEIVSRLSETAVELQKVPPLVKTDITDISLQQQHYTLLENTFLHILNNCMDHGIELPEEREAAGKKKQGTISISSTIQSNRCLRINIKDDGRGINLDAIFKKLSERGITERPNDQELAKSIFQPDFSTAKSATMVSGRGVGLDAVKAMIKQEGGTINIVFDDDHEGSQFRDFHLEIMLPMDALAAHQAA